MLTIIYIIILKFSGIHEFLNEIPFLGLDIMINYLECHFIMYILNNTKILIFSIITIKPLFIVLFKDYIKNIKFLNIFTAFFVIIIDSFKISIMLFLL